MKTNILKTLTVFLFLMVSIVGIGFAKSREVILVKAPVILVDENPIGDRIPSRPIQCTISEEGIFIQGYDASEILYYEVYDLEGACLFCTVDQEEFISYILTDKNCLEIKFHISGVMLKGYI